MKTILIVIAGMGDLPDPVSLRDTPLATSATPSLDILAARGDITSFPTVDERHELSHKNALLSILGYDLDRGELSIEELMEFGLDSSTPLTAYSSLRPFVIPGFSGHGICVTTSAWVRGAAKCALLQPVDIYSPGSSDAEILETMSGLVTEAVGDNEFIFVYTDTPLKASLRGDFQGKVSAIEQIDRHLVTPIADFVWKSDLLINMAVTTDLVTTWHRRMPVKLNVPAVLYFNNHDWDGDPNQRFSEVQAMLMPHYFNVPSDLIRYLCNFYVSDEETAPE